MLEGADPGGPNQTITLRESMKIIPGRRKRTGRRYPRRVCTYTISLFLSLSFSLSLSLCVSPAAIQRARVPIAKIVERSSSLEAQVSLSPVPNSSDAISRRSCTPLCRSYPPLTITCLRVADISIIKLITRSSRGVKDNVVAPWTCLPRKKSFLRLQRANFR